MDLLKKLRDAECYLGFHNFETTHTNKWFHPTRQQCQCGLVREFRFMDGHESMKGMPWELGEWAWSNGKTTKYSVAD